MVRFFNIVASTARSLFHESRQQVENGVRLMHFPPLGGLPLESDCSGFRILGQQSMRDSRQRSTKLMSVAPTRQSLLVRAVPILVGLLLGIPCSFTHAELFDALDAYPPRWQLDTSDCDARVLDRKNLASGGMDGGGCEAITFHATVGSEVILVYPIEPLRCVDDLVANLSVMSAREGARVGLRVRFPYHRDPHTHRPFKATLYGATYNRAARFESRLWRCTKNRNYEGGGVLDCDY